MIKTPHKHAEVIKAWADGAVIQVKVGMSDWDDCRYNHPGWVYSHEYRVKPEPKPDNVQYMRMNQKSHAWHNEPSSMCNLKLTFDGETGKLKSAEVL